MSSQLMIVLFTWPVFLYELGKREVGKIVAKIGTVEHSLLESGLATVKDRLKGELGATQESIQKLDVAGDAIAEPEDYSDDLNLLVTTFLLMFYAVLRSCLKLYIKVTRTILRLVGK